MEVERLLGFFNLSSYLSRLSSLMYECPTLTSICWKNPVIYHLLRRLRCKINCTKVFESRLHIDGRRDK